MTSTLLRLLLVPPWFAAIYGTLQLHSLNLRLGQHTICGPWGCGPRVEALLGYHGFWLVLLLPLAAVIGQPLAAATNRRIGFWLLAVALAGTIGYVSWDVIDYSSKAGSLQHAAQRGLFTLVTTVDVPLLQTALGGALLWGVFGRSRSATVESQVVGADTTTST